MSFHPPPPPQYHQQQQQQQQQQPQQPQHPPFASLPNGLPKSSEFSRFLPPTGLGSQHLPQQQQPPINQPQQSVNYVQQQQHQQHNNGSNSNLSSRTASPAINKSINVAHMPPNLISQQKQQMVPPPNPAAVPPTSQNETMFLPNNQQKLPNMTGMVQPPYQQNAGSNPNITQLTSTIRNVSLNGPPTIAAAAPLPNAFTGTQFNGNQQRPPPIDSQLNGPPLMQSNVTNQPFAQNNNQSSIAPNKRPLYPSQLPPTQQLPNYPQSQNFNSQSYSKPLQYQNLNQPPAPPQQHPQQLHQHQQQPPQQLQQQQQQPQYNFQNNLQQQQQQPPNKLNITQQGFSKLWGHETVDLMQHRHILPTTRVQPPPIELGHEFFESVNCSSDILRCTVTKIPESNSLLQKSRLPLGILIHPFKDLNNLPVIQCSAIVRCRSCRTYINPFVTFVDSKKWRCNLCYRVNELPDEFQYDPVSKSYGDVTRRPEVKSSTIEFIAPSEYMLRPPQPPIYLFLLDVSQMGQQCGYLNVVCQTISDNLDNLPGDARTKVGFIAYNSAVHFYSIAEGYNQPHEITVVDIDDPFLPCPDNLLINLKECRDLIADLLVQLPKRFANSYDSNSALGSALQIAFKLMHQSGGRVTVFQTCLPNVGPGALKPRENPNDRSAKDVQFLGPATDFYKRLALECSAQQIAVDVFLLNSQYSDLATVSGISKFSGGCLHHFPLFNCTKLHQVELFKKSLERYLTRKIGFESVMRVRCTRGLAIHTFHGNFFVRSTDLLSLPNVNPDAGFGMQITYEENISDTKTVCFQAALLYTSSKGERRIRVHTLCLPVTSSLSDVMHSADCQAIIGLISKMAVDRSLQTNISDARDAFINASIDVFSSFRIAQNLPQGAQGQLIAPVNLSLLPLYMMALLKYVAFRTGTSTRLDDRVFAMCELKTLPLDQLIRCIYPDFYHLDSIFYGTVNADDGKFDLPILQLSAERLDSRSVFMLDTGPCILILVGTNVPAAILQNVFNVSTIAEIPDLCFELPSTGKPENEALHSFIDSISVDKPFSATIQIIRDTSPSRSLFTEKLVDDRSESSLSYYEFLQHLRTQVK